MITLERCRKLAKEHGYVYTDDQLIKIRDFLYQLAAIEYKAYKRRIDEQEKSYHLHESVVRRAS